MMKLYDVELDEMYGEMRYVVTLDTRGVRSGYVGIPEGHILYGLECESILRIADCMGNNAGLSIEDMIDIDHEVGYAEGGTDSFYPVQSDLWWFGFNAVGEVEEVKDICRVLVDQLYGVAKHNWRIIGDVEPKGRKSVRLSPIDPNDKDQDAFIRKLVEKSRSGNEEAYETLKDIFQQELKYLFSNSNLANKVGPDMAYVTAHDIFRAIVLRDFDIDGAARLDEHITYALPIALNKIAMEMNKDSRDRRERVEKKVEETLSKTGPENTDDQLSDENDIIKAVVVNVADELPETERKFVCRYYGIGEYAGQRAKSFSENAKTFGLTNYQAKKISNGFIRRLREKGVQIPE